MLLSKYDEVAKLFSYSGILTPEYFKYLNDNVIPFYTKWFDSDMLMALSKNHIFKECRPLMYQSEMDDLLALIGKKYNVDDITFDNLIKSINYIINDDDFQMILCDDALGITDLKILSTNGTTPFISYFLNRLHAIAAPISKINVIIKNVLPIRIDLYWISRLNIELNSRIEFNPEFFEFIDDVEKMKGFTITDIFMGLKMIMDDESHVMGPHNYSYSLAIAIGWLYFNIESRLSDRGIDTRIDTLNRIINY